MPFLIELLASPIVVFDGSLAMVTAELWQSLAGNPTVVAVTRTEIFRAASAVWRRYDVLVAAGDQRPRCAATGRCTSGFPARCRGLRSGTCPTRRVPLIEGSTVATGAAPALPTIALLVDVPAL